METAQKTNKELLDCARALILGQNAPHLFRGISWEDYDKAMQMAIEYADYAGAVTK